MGSIREELIKRIEQHLATLPPYKDGITHEKQRHEFVGKCVEILNELINERKFDKSRKEELLNFITPTIISLTDRHMEERPIH